MTKICLFIIGPTKRDGKLMGIAKSATNSSWLERLLQVDFKGFTGNGTSKQTLSFTNMYYNRADEVRS